MWLYIFMEDKSSAAMEEAVKKQLKAAKAWPIGVRGEQNEHGLTPGIAGTTPSVEEPRCLPPCIS